MLPVNVEPIGCDLAIKWDDGQESFISLERLRLSCPCAGCKGEKDILGNVYKNPPQKLAPSAFQLQRLMRVGTYAIQPIWADGHATGIYSFDYLRRLAETAGKIALGRALMVAMVTVASRTRESNFALKICQGRTGSGPRAW